MRIAYFSPFSPDKSGVSDFSEELVLELANLCEVDLFTNKPIENNAIINDFKIYDIDEIEKEEIRKQYDYLVYQVGNNRNYHKSVIDMFLKYPGILELHDLSLHHYLAEDTFVQKDYDKYIEIMKYCHGKEGEITAKRFLNGEIRAPWENQSFKFTVNKHLIDKATAVIVHSDMAKQLVKGIRPDVSVINIPLHTTEIIKNYNDYNLECKDKLGLSDYIVMGSFGYATKAKRIESIIKALSKLKEENVCKFRYCIVGKMENICIEELKRQYNLEDEIITTGFTTLDEFKIYMGACDICFNLRYPTQGESSASLHRLFGMGKVILVTNIGAFEEYPDDVVTKIDYNNQEVPEILACLKEVVGNLESFDARRKRVFEYAEKNCCLKTNAKRYYDFLINVKENGYQDEYIDHLLDVLQVMGILSEEYIELLVNKYL